MRSLHTLGGGDLYEIFRNTFLYCGVYVCMYFSTVLQALLLLIRV